MRKNFCWASAWWAHGATAPNAVPSTKAFRRVIFSIVGLLQRVVSKACPADTDYTRKQNPAIGDVSSGPQPAVAQSRAWIGPPPGWLWAAARPAASSTSSERPRLHAVHVALQVLPDEVVADEAHIGVGEPLGHRPPHLTLRADVDAVHLGHRADAQRRGGEEHLVGVVGIVQ